MNIAAGRYYVRFQFVPAVLVVVAVARAVVGVTCHDVVIAVDVVIRVFGCADCDDPVARRWSRYFVVAIVAHCRYCHDACCHGCVGRLRDGVGAVAAAAGSDRHRHHLDAGSAGAPVLVGVVGAPLDALQHVAARAEVGHHLDVDQPRLGSDPHVVRLAVAVVVGLASRAEGGRGGVRPVAVTVIRVTTAVLLGRVVVAAADAVDPRDEPAFESLVLVVDAGVKDGNVDPLPLQLSVPGDVIVGRRVARLDSAYRGIEQRVVDRLPLDQSETGQRGQPADLVRRHVVQLPDWQVVRLVAGRQPQRGERLPLRVAGLRVENEEDVDRLATRQQRPQPVVDPVPVSVKIARRELRCSGTRHCRHR